MKKAWLKEVLADAVREKKSWPEWAKQPAQTAKPPLGIEPEWLWRSRRVGGLLDAIERYAEAGKPISPEWVTELREHIQLRDRLKG